MSDINASAPDPVGFKDAAARSQGAGIADEMAAFASAAPTGGPPAIDEGDPATKHGGSGIGETD